jgi:predicted anti-sigma-YlaC factor YlaD
MRCDEIQEQLVDFVYEEAGAFPSNSEVQEHLRACSACREEVEELKRTCQYLQLWREEPPLRSVSLAKFENGAKKHAGFRYLRYAAVAAMVLISLLALVNTRISWNKNGLTFSTHLLSRQNAERDYYTKAEMSDLMKDALDYTNETNYLMMQKMLDTVEQDRWRDIRLIRDQVAKNQN